MTTREFRLRKKIDQLQDKCERLQADHDRLVAKYVLPRLDRRPLNCAYCGRQSYGRVCYLCIDLVALDPLAPRVAA